MKKVVSMVIILVMLMGIVSTSFAYFEPQKIAVKIDGKMVSVKQINVQFNGEPIEADVPPILYQERTLVPIRFIANYLNADVEWDPETYQVKITLPDKEIILAIDSNKVNINGVTKNLPYDVPAKLVNSRTMVPLRFVSEELGCDVEWNGETWTGNIVLRNEDITDVVIEEREGSLPIISIDTTGTVAHSEVFLEEPYRLVIDIPNSNINIENNKILGSNGQVNIESDTYPIKSIESFLSQPKGTRFVIELEDKLGYTVNNTEDNKLEIRFLNRVTEIKMEEVSGKEAIAIYNTNQPEYNIIKLTNPDRVVFDLMDSYLAEGSATYDYETKYIKGVRTSQFTPDSLYNKGDKIVRVVVDIKEGNSDVNLRAEVKKDKILLVVDNKEIKGIEYSSDEDNKGSITIEAEKITKYDVEYDSEGRLLKVSVPKKYIDIESGMQVINDDLVSTILVEEDDDNKVITLKLKGNIEYKVNSNPRDDEIDISFVKRNTKYSDRLIVIDAGHGGKDPGTMGYITKTMEKVLNLSVALKLNEKLKAEGFNTILTRSTDEFIDLYERAGIANRNNADAFISVHFNAHPDKNVRGIQTLYCPAYESEVKTGDNFPFAEVIHNELLNELDMVDKGIIRRPNLVVIRETSMVAALVELGFVTNSEEEKLVVTEEYHQKAADAIVNGVKRYFDEVAND